MRRFTRRPRPYNRTTMLMLGRRIQPRNPQRKDVYFSLFERTVFFIIFGRPEIIRIKNLTHDGRVCDILNTGKEPPEAFTKRGTKNDQPNACRALRDPETRPRKYRRR